MRRRARTDSRIVGFAIAAYLVVALAASIEFKLSLTPDRIVILLLIAALGTGRVREFFRDWSIFLVVLLAWQFLSGLGTNLVHLRPHVSEMIVADKFLFVGNVPTVWLQQHLYHHGQVAWYDVVATVLYFLHFVVPMLAAFAFWLWNRSVFLEFMAGFLIVALAGFVTYVLFPAAPPWWAANHLHVLPHVYQVKDGISLSHGVSVSTVFNWIWQHGGWDNFGAVPSEHAAFPFLCFLYARHIWRRLSWLLLVYSAAVWLAVVYLGEHYVIDVIVGVLYAASAYAVVRVLASRRAGPSYEGEERRPSRSVRDSLSA